MEEYALPILSDGGSLISAAADLFNASRDRALKEHLNDKNNALQEKIANRRNELEERMNDLRVKQQEALANADRKQQVELADKNRKLQWEITLFTEYSRRQSALKEINQRFYTDNFPLYIRMENYCDLVEVGKVPAVKIVFSPPVIDAGNGNNHALNGIDVLMTARMTRFLNELYSDENGINPFCEYVGNAWRNKQFRGQSAYRYIFNEFSGEPFMIVDCEVVREYLAFQVCYWLPGDETYRICQVLDGIRMDSFLKKGIDGNPDFDYDAVIDVIIALAEISAGTMVDLYQMASGNLEEPCFFKKFSDILARLPEEGGLRRRVEQLAVRQYLKLADSKKEKLADPGKGKPEQYSVLLLGSHGNSRVGRFQNSVAFIHTSLLLAEFLSRREDDGFAAHYFSAAWETWCTLFGLPASIFLELFEQGNIREIFLEELRRDSAMEGALQRLFFYRDRPYALEYCKMLNILAEWSEEDWICNPELYQITSEEAETSV